MQNLIKMFAGANVNACHLDLCNNPSFSAGRIDLVQRGERQRFYRHRTQTGAPALHLQHGVNENIKSFFLFFTIDNFYDGQVRAGDFERQLCNLAGRQQVPHSLDQETKSESSGQLRITYDNDYVWNSVDNDDCDDDSNDRTFCLMCCWLGFLHFPCLFSIHSC